MLLVVASAGFGALFAWQTGSRNGIALGVLSVAMALGLEMAKPFAVSGALGSFRRFRIITGIALLSVGLLAVGYSLQAELTYMSAARGDLAAARATDAAAVSRAEARYMAAVDALAELKPAGTSKSATAAYLARREALVTEVRNAEVDRRAAPAEIVADPGADALATYSAALGFQWDAQQLGKWLPLVGVLALEIGAAFAVVLVQSVAPAGSGAGPAVTQQVGQQTIGSPDVAVQDQPAGSAETAREPGNDGPGGPAARRGLTEVLAALQTGVHQGSQRTIARALGTSKSTVLRAQRMLETQQLRTA
ncbi:hypothetical protein [Hyphomicrobium sp. D-2]|uniref:hypothetical protein n=1 Tax=Hyphomicrobium sp. D-2 TaxID=3041621 RepID=UPI0024586ADC|nr:hypothetical protein [Hyphomicrobium sp. D-2]MDH4981468.1 hypothetical protein [Hyphomicrobium sp. D-2]